MIEKTFGPTNVENNLFDAMISSFNIKSNNIDKNKLVTIPNCDNFENYRIDFTKNNVLTIDPPKCLDMDDAIHFTKLNSNKFQIGVHITDVSHFVESDSDVDKEAQKRLTSIYAPHKVINMLPKELAENHCSLIEGEDRFTISVLIDFDNQGNYINYKIVPGLVNVSKNYTYSEFEKLIEYDSELNDFFNLLKKLILIMIIT